MQQLTKFILTIPFIIPLEALAQQIPMAFSKTDSLFVFNSNISEAKKRRMADSAFVNFSTAPNFVVVIATNQITGKTKEICSEAPFIKGGIDRNRAEKIISVKNKMPINRHYSGFVNG